MPQGFRALPHIFVLFLGSEAPNSPPTPEMALLGRRDLSETFVDDQSPTLRNSYVGKWTKQYDGNYTEWYLGTYTYSSNHGDSLSFSFTGISTILTRSSLRGVNAMTGIGTQLWLYGGLSDTRISQNGNFAQYPTAEYLFDGNPGEFFGGNPLANTLLTTIFQSVPNSLTLIPARTSFTSSHKISKTALTRSNSR